MTTVVRPALTRGAVVVSDRYVDSSLAYQGAGRTLPVDQVSWLSSWATGGLKPDLVVLLDIDPHTGLYRAAARSGAADRLESESVAFHERVRYAFLDLASAEPDRYLVLDAHADPEVLAVKVRDRVAHLLPPDPPAADPVPPAQASPPVSDNGGQPARDATTAADTGDADTGGIPAGSGSGSGQAAESGGR